MDYQYIQQMTNEFQARIIYFVIFSIPFIWSIVWSYKDAKLRGKQPILVALMIALVSWPASILIWLIFRPNKK